MDNDTASIGTNNDKCALLNVGDGSHKSEEEEDNTDYAHAHHLQNPLHLFTSSDFDISSAHRSCPDLSLSLSLESIIRTFERERATSASIKHGVDGNGASRLPGASGVPLSTIATNLLLPTPKTGTNPVDIALMNRICKSMSNIDGLGAARAKKKVYFQHGTKQPEIVEPMEEDFFELIERLNANRLQDQRAEFPSATVDEEGGEQQGGKLLGANADALLAMIAEMQSRRYDDQRASPVLSDYETKEILRRLSLRAPNERIDKKVVDEQLYDLIMSYQGSRLEDQRSELGGRNVLENGSNSSSKSSQKNNGGQLVKKDSKKKKAFCKSNSSTMK